MVGNMNSKGIASIVSGEQSKSLQKKHFKKNTRAPWQDHELNILKSYYILLGAKYCQWFLPDRTIHSIRHKAIEIGLIRSNKDAWSQSELDVVINGVSDQKTTGEIKNDLESKGFHRSQVAVRDCKLSIINKYSAL